MNHGKIACAILLAVIFSSLLSASTPHLLNYQGKLNQRDGSPASGTFSMVFSIYSDSAGTTHLWREAQPTITVVNGIFNILLGAVLPFPDDLFTTSGDRYLGIKVGAEPEMRPLFHLTSVPYAMHANSATTISALPVVGRWYATNHEAPGPVNYQWGTEILNTDPACLARASLNYEIEVKKAGYYLVCVNVLQMGLSSGQRGNVYVYRNGGAIGYSLGYGGGEQYIKHNLSIIEYFKQGDKITVSCRNAKTHCLSDPWSSLEIHKLN